MSNVMRIHNVNELRALKPGDFAIIPGNKVAALVRVATENQTRYKEADERDHLRESIMAEGIRVPVLVTAPLPTTEMVDLIAGFHRVKELTELNGTVRAEDPIDLPIRVVAAKTHKEALLKGISDNAQRQQTSRIDDSHAINLAIKAGAARKDIAAALGVSVQRVSQLEALANLPKPLKDAIHEGVSESVARLAIKPTAGGSDIKLVDLKEDQIKQVLAMATENANDRQFGKRKPRAENGESYGVHNCTVREIADSLKLFLDEVPEAAPNIPTSEPIAAATTTDGETVRNETLPVGNGPEAANERGENETPETPTPVAGPITPQAPLNEDVENGKRSRVLSDVVKLFSDKAAGASPESPMLVLCQQVVAFIDGKASRADVFSAMNDLEHFVPYTERLKIEDQTMQKIAKGDKVGSKPAAPKAKSAA